MTEVVPTSGVVGAPRFTAPRAGTGSGFAFRRRRLGGTERAPERRVACAFRECLGRLCVQVRLDVRNLDPALERRDLEQEEHRCPGAAALRADGGCVRTAPRFAFQTLTNNVALKFRCGDIAALYHFAWTERLI